MEVVYRRLPRHEFDRIASNPDEVHKFLHAPLPGFDPKTLSALMKDPKAMQARRDEFLAAFQQRREDPTRADLDKDWHALHFLLTGDASLKIEHRPNDPLHNLVMGGHATALQTGYGPARLFSVEDVQAIARELNNISVEDLRKRFSADAFNRADIYPRPRPRGWNDREIETVYHSFPKLVRFFQEAVNSQEIVVVYVS